MRSKLFIILLAIFASCSDVDPNQLTGTWTSKTNNTSFGKKVIDKTTFSPQGDFSLELFIDDSLQQEIHGKYKFDANTNLIRVQGDSGHIDMEVLKLNAKELELMVQGQKVSSKYVRY